VGLISNLLTGNVKTEIPKYTLQAIQHINEIYHHINENYANLGMKIQ